MYRKGGNGKQKDHIDQKRQKRGERDYTHKALVSLNELKVMNLWRVLKSALDIEFKLSKKDKTRILYLVFPVGKDDIKDSGVNY